MVIQPGGTSVGGTATSSSSSAIAIPPLSNGANPKWVHIALVSESAGAVFIFGPSSSVAAATVSNGIGIGSYHGDMIVNVAGNTHYKVIRATSGNAVYTMTPLAGIVAGG